MPPTPKTVLNLHFTLKPGTRENMLAELRTIFEHCVQEPEFITAVLQEHPDYPDQLIVFELWHGTREDFVRVQGPKPYRQEYIVRSRQYTEKVAVSFTAPLQEWGTDLLDR